LIEPVYLEAPPDSGRTQPWPMLGPPCIRSWVPARMKRWMLARGLNDVTLETVVDFDSFFRTHFERVARAAALVVRDPWTGQELAQEAFARLFERWGDMDSEDHARNFAYQVAINLARSHMRKHVRVSLFGLRRSEEPWGADAASRSDDWLQVADALRALSPRQRACVVLVDYADMDTAGAARVLGMGAGTVRVHLMRGRRALRESLGLPAKEEPR
jgi:RNA polymerase sigma-70 factor, ECF subfamily